VVARHGHARGLGSSDRGASRRLFRPGRWDRRLGGRNGGLGSGEGNDQRGWQPPRGAGDLRAAARARRVEGYPGALVAAAGEDRDVRTAV